MRKIRDKIRDIFETFSLTVLLTLNLFFIVFLLLAVTTVLVWSGVDGGFLVQEGRVTISGGLVLIYAVCILVAVSMVFMIRRVFIRPIREVMDAMNSLASGDFSVRIRQEDVYRPREIREFRESFNKAAEELSGTQLLRKDFVNNFSHEFKTPIVSISGFAELLMEEDLTEEERQEYLTIIRDESRRLAELATSILTLNRVESQAILTDRENFRLDEQIRQSVLVTQQKWRDKDLDMSVDLEPAEYMGSEALLKEVWLNILDNAAKFSPEGGTIGVTMRAEKAENDDGPGAVTVAVTDNGPGMDEHTRAHIFEQFYQGDTSHRSQGNGLGLAMVRKIVELHSGSIEVDTAPGRGCCFTVRLP
ncbi:MAG: HAMP domain-containing histidine kinase [Lachnospiraceae bacterium]|nr:HAMP domain-containing histidine kinase [Lachnospiraceae bacterium]